MRHPFVVPLTLVGLALALPVADSLAEEVTGAGVYKYCQACHGPKGMGAQDGKYPRLAGLPEPYVARQITAFKSQKRVNKPMIPIFKNRRFDAAVIDVVAAYVASMPESSLNLWPYQPSAEALAELGSKEAFVAAGAEAYDRDCALCHGTNGRGDPEGDAPPLVNQYPRYLEKQMGDFAAGRRSHADAARCGAVAGVEREAVLNHLVDLGR